jgi:cobalt-precorrin 5A hydrolase/precorrin-3B C17-methyltransferase
MDTASKTVFFYVTEQGLRLAEALSRGFPDAAALRFTKATVARKWKTGGRLVFIMAAGIVVRTIAPYLSGKRTDPAVVVLDEKGRHAVSLLGGHEAGANALAGEIAHLCGGAAVITTASDVSGLPAIDLWAKAQGLVIQDPKALPKAGTRLLNGKSLRLFSDVAVDAPPAFRKVDLPAKADIIVTNRVLPAADVQPGALVLRPRNLVAGVGCNSGTSADEIEKAVRAALDSRSLSFLSVRAVATIDRKGDEPGLAAFAARNGLPVLTFLAAELNGVSGVALSAPALKATGARAVAEPSAVLGAGGGPLLVKKRKAGNVTVAVAEERPSGPAGRGTIYVVGLGPGSLDHLTPAASAAIAASGAIVGYGPYLDLIGPLIAGKKRVTTGMSREIERCEKAVELAAGGLTVSLVSGGDPGIYAMAGPLLEVLKNGNAAAGCRVEIVPGVSALSACAARLGAPLMHDFAAISLSDRLTPWRTIEDRLDAAARADFVIVLYNPRSKGRAGHTKKAQAVILRHRDPKTPVGIVRAATRPGEGVTVTELGRIPFEAIDMQTTVIVGNSRTTVWNGMMITPRGYENKERG